MAKRTRASRSARRPGGQGPNRTKKPSGSEAGSANPVDPAVSTDQDVDMSGAGVEVDEVAAAAVAAATTGTAQASPEPTTGRRTRRRAARTTKRKSQDDLTSRAAAETAWVREDLRRIGIVSVLLIAALAAAYVVFGVLDVLSLY